MDNDLLQGKVFISKDLNLYYYYFDEEKEEVDFKPLGFLEVMAYLGEPVVIEKGFTLRNYFELVDNYRAFQMLDVFFECFLEEFKNCPKEGCRDSEIDYIVINRHIVYESPSLITPSTEQSDIFELISSEDGNIHVDKSIDHTIEVHGYKENKNQFYALDMSSLSSLLDYEIMIDKTRLFVDNKEYSAEQYDLNLFEFIKNVIWELSFYGQPDQRDAEKEKLEEALNNLDESFKQ